jgi:hypothetical protein
MVSTQHKKILWVLDLVRKQEADTLQALRPTIYIVSKKEVVRLRREASIFKKAQKIRISAFRR